MSDDIENTPAAPEAPAAKVAKKRPAVRKSSKPAAKKAEEAAPAAAVESAPSEPAAAAPAPAPRKEEVKTAGPSEAAEVNSSEASDGGRIALFVDTPAPEPGGGSKKRRRRKKKHGQSQGGQAGGQHPHAVSAPAEAPTGQAVAPAGEAHQPSHQPAMHAAPRPKLDPEQVAKKAWKIFQSEVGEEGLALIDDHDAREISRRCFRLAEIFLEEAARRGQR
ncbi:hypothetical protein OJ996_24140 [Luteolibacter sp. GHJ8]|uniref:Uncharacterized protein n=1 Tax=Luteolibacter rhizosphaerae TaxID=2989719 RepID=A0ABT3GA21_9BACT|nr:hypothetical protein [Luteolibacter rhizosphaerae]MCW1916699.1 hypothetical protein [Luteolibacter rhizosphaerae]